MELIGLVPSVIPCSMAQFIPASYHVDPVVVSTPAIRAITVKIIALDISIDGSKVVSEVPVKYPASVTSQIASTAHPVPPRSRKSGAPVSP